MSSDLESGGDPGAFVSAVIEDARQRLAAQGIDLTQLEMISWATIYLRLKQTEAGRASFFNVLSAFAVSEAACQHEMMVEQDESG